MKHQFRSLHFDALDRIRGHPVATSGRVGQKEKEKVFMLNKITLSMVALLLALSVGVVARPGTQALADPGNGANYQVMLCKATTSFGSIGQCVSYWASYGQSNAWASPLCDYIAYTDPGKGYGFRAGLFYQSSLQYFGTVGPMMNQGQCVNTLGQALKGVSAYVVPCYIIEECKTLP
jgi:hypothetical protein